MVVIEVEDGRRRLTTTRVSRIEPAEGGGILVETQRSRYHVAFLVPPRGDTWTDRELGR